MTDWLAYDLALLHSASRFDLSDQKGRTESAKWLRELFISLVAALRPRVVLELGAAEASFSAQVRSLLDKGEVHALEANPHLYRKHRREADAAGVRYHNLAVGPQDGRVSFKLGTHKDGQELSPTKTNNSILEKALDIQYRAIEVDMVTVDGFVDRQGLTDRSCAMWVDTEGLAYDVLCGAERTLKATRALLVEVEDKPFWIGQHLAHEVKALICEAGFIPVARDFEYTGQYNVLFLSREHFHDHYVRRVLEQAFAGKGGLS